jgi:hypothetical protein
MKTLYSLWYDIYKQSASLALSIQAYMYMVTTDLKLFPDNTTEKLTLKITPLFLVCIIYLP